MNSSIGSLVAGLRLPFLREGDDLIEHIVRSIKDSGLTPGAGDIIGVTESIVARTQGNYVAFDEVGKDLDSLFAKNGENYDLNVFSPIMSRNRFVPILKALVTAGNLRTLKIILVNPDEQGNRMDKEGFHAITGVNYAELYSSINPKVSVTVVKEAEIQARLKELNCRSKKVLIARVHDCDFWCQQLSKANVITLKDLCCNASKGRNGWSEFGLLGSNSATENKLKLFPHEGSAFIRALVGRIHDEFDVTVEALIYGDGAFKDPVTGIWELADPCVSPAFTEGLRGSPREIKLKAAIDSGVNSGGIFNKIKENSTQEFGTTPRQISDLVGSLCDLTSGSGDKGTPLVYVKGYFSKYPDKPVSVF